MPRYANPERTDILTDDGATLPVDPGNRDYARLIASGVEIAAYLPPTAPSLQVSKLTVIARLNAKGVFGVVLGALKENDLLYEQWAASPYIASDNIQVHQLFEAIGLDPDEILAPDSGAP